MTWLYSRWARAQLKRCCLAAVLVGAVVAVVVWVQPRTAQLSVLCSNNESSCRAVGDAFRERTGITVEIVRMPTSEALGRIRMSSQRPEFDVWLGGPAESYSEAAAEGLLSPIGDLKSVAKLPTSMRDASGYWAGVYGGILSFCVNTDLVKHAPQSWDDLLSGEYRGQILMPNPLLSGTASTMLWVQYSRLGSTASMVDYMHSLESNLQGYSDSGTAVAHKVANGEASMGVSFAPYCQAERESGAPVKVTYPSEGTGYEVGGAGVLSSAQQTAKAREFVDFAVSAAGQQASAAEVEQSRTTTDAEPNLVAELEELPVPVLGGQASHDPGTQRRLIMAWAKKVRHGTY